eukprot:COSAG02_NODE_5915_length_3941_cov_41.067673_1_plen_275_part_10
MEAPPADDLAAQLYLALSRGERGIEKILDSADAEGLRRVSEWRGRRPPAEGATPTGKEPYATRGLTALHVLAADCTDVVAVSRAIDLAGVVTLKTVGGFYATREEAANWRPIHLAARSNSSPEVVQKLLDAGGVEQLQAKDSDGALPIHLAAMSNSSLEVVQKLLDAGGPKQLQAKNSNGALPIHRAARSNSSPEVVQKLLDAGGPEQLQAKDSDGALPIHLAARSNSSPEVVQKLLDAGGPEQLQAKDSDGDLPIHLAAMSNSSLEVVQKLLDA